MVNPIQKTIAQTFLDMARGLETGQFVPKPKIGVTGLGSELGEDNVTAGALAATDADVLYLGTRKVEGLQTVEVTDEDQCHSEMETRLQSGDIAAAVTMHYPFPIGVSTVGRAIAPGTGRQIFIATTTGTSSTDRVESMVINAVYGIIAAKSCGIQNPTLGILNVDGARATYAALLKLQQNGYDITFAESQRSDGGCILRGNDVLTGAADIIVTDSLTGNILMKMLSSYTTGGGVETVGYGYGPGIGQDFNRLVMIISRASGPPVIAGAISYAVDLIRGGYLAVSADELNRAKKAGLEEVRKERTYVQTSESLAPPPVEVVTAQLSGIEIMDLEDAVHSLWKDGIYAQSGMGCTGPIILVAEDKQQRAFELLKASGWITQ